MLFIDAYVFCNVLYQVELSEDPGYVRVDGLYPKPNPDPSTSSVRSDYLKKKKTDGLKTFKKEERATRGNNK